MLGIMSLGGAWAGEGGGGGSAKEHFSAKTVFEAPIMSLFFQTAVGAAGLDMSGAMLYMRSQQFHGLIRLL